MSSPAVCSYEEMDVSSPSIVEMYGEYWDLFKQNTSVLSGIRIGFKELIFRLNDGYRATGELAQAEKSLYGSHWLVILSSSNQIKSSAGKTWATISSVASSSAETIYAATPPEICRALTA